VRRGRVYRRCSRCGRAWQVNDDGHAARRCAHCGSERFRWAYSVDVGPVGGPRDQRAKMGFGTKREAVAAMSALQAELGDGTYVEASRLTVGEYLTDWLKLAKRRLRPGSYDSCAIHVNTYLIPRIGGLRLQSLSGRRVKQLYAELAASGRARGGGGLSEKSVHNIHTTLSRALRDAVSDRLLAQNPASGAHRQPESPEQDTWTATQLAAFLESVRDDRLFAMWRVLALTGLRRGEICGLRRRDLDLDQARLFVVQQRAKGGGSVHTGKTKGRRGRVVALDSHTVQALRAHLKAQGVEREQLGAGYTDHGLVFCHEDGRPLHPDSVTKRFARLVDASGLPVITVHELRHSHATLLLQASVHPKVVQERLGHSTISVTYDTYTHSVPGLQDDAAERAARLLNPNKGLEDEQEPHEEERQAQEYEAE
jgi:integrase